MHKKLFLSLAFLFLDPSAKSISEIKFDNITILVNSCDKYSDLWESFNHFLFKQWPSLKTYNTHIPILFISNSISYINPRITSVKVPNETSWSDTFLKALESVETDYVLILLEDYIINKPVNEQRLQELFLGMQKANAAYLQIGNDNPIHTTGKLHSNISGLRFSGKHDKWRTSLQSCIWHKDDLKWILKEGEGIWDFEVAGSTRSEGLKKPFLKTLADHPISYLNAAQEGYLNANVIAWIHQNGGSIEPTKLPVDGNHKIKLYIKAALKSLKNNLSEKIYPSIKNFIKSSF